MKKPNVVFLAFLALLLAGCNMLRQTPPASSSGILLQETDFSDEWSWSLTTEVDAEESEQLAGTDPGTFQIGRGLMGIHKPSGDSLSFFHLIKQRPAAFDREALAQELQFRFDGDTTPAFSIPAPALGQASSNIRCVQSEPLLACEVAVAYDCVVSKLLAISPKEIERANMEVLFQEALSAMDGRITANEVGYCQETHALPTPLPTLQARPAFVLDVSPQESTVIPLPLFREDRRDQHLEETGVYLAGGWGSPEAGYRSSVCIHLDLEPIAQTDDDFTDPERIGKRIEMRIDGRELNGVSDYSFTPTLHQRGSTKWTGPISFCWMTDIGPGAHTADFSFRLSSNVTRKYAWQFMIVED